MVTQESMWNAVKDLSDEEKQEVYNFAITLKDSSNVFAPISEEQMKLVESLILGYKTLGKRM